VAILVLEILVLVSSVLPPNIKLFNKYLPASTSSSVTVTVNNALPVASGVTLNGGGAITLTESSTQSVAVAATITDNNGCEDLASATVAVYKVGTTCTAIGNADNDNCYFTTATISCSGSLSYNLSQNFNIQYYADSTANWRATVTPSDQTGAGSSIDSSADVALNPLQALSVSDLNYGSLNPGASSTGDHTVSVTNTGDTAVDYNLHGTDLTCGGGGIGSIPVADQQYKLVSFVFGAGTALTGTDADASTNIAKSTQSSNPSTGNIYWQIGVPNGVKGSCSGSTTFTAKAP
jgi:hypothetical protein